MARVLEEGTHFLVVHDPVSASEITLHYRRPTSEERVAYQLSAFRLEGGARRFCLGETRLKFGLEILTGFNPGDFLVATKDGPAPLDPEADPLWKERLKEHAPDLVSFLAQQIFEGLRILPGGEQGCS